MQLEALKQEFIFHCKYRKLSPKTVRNYEKQIGYLLRFLELRSKVMIMLFADTGIRLSELIELTGEQMKDDFIIIWGK